MGRQRLPKASLRDQLVAVRRAASSAALECRSDGERLRSHRTKAETHRDNLVSAAITLSAIEASRAALSMMPDAQRDQLEIRLVEALVAWPIVCRVMAELEAAYPRLFCLSIALMVLAVCAPVLSPVALAIGLVSVGVVGAIEVLHAILSLVGFRTLAPSPSERFAAPLTGDPERTAFA